MWEWGCTPSVSHRRSRCLVGSGAVTKNDHLNLIGGGETSPEPASSNNITGLLLREDVADYFLCPTIQRKSLMNCRPSASTLIASGTCAIAAGCLPGWPAVILERNCSTAAYKRNNAHPTERIGQLPKKRSPVNGITAAGSSGTVVAVQEHAPVGALDTRSSPSGNRSWTTSNSNCPLIYLRPGSPTRYYWRSTTRWS